MSMLVLVMDDETDMAARFCRPFRRKPGAGRFAVKFAAFAPDALEVIEATDGRNMIVLFTDIKMSGMNGLELLPMIRATRPDLPPVISTAHVNAGTRRREPAPGAEEMLPRPLDFVALRPEVERRLERRRAGA